MTMLDHVTQHVEFKQKLGYQFTTQAGMLKSFARFAEAEEFIRSSTALAWAATASSRPRRARRLHVVRNFALWVHAEDNRHQVPPAVAFGPASRYRHTPTLISIPEIQRLLSAALSTKPAATINPLTWHYLFGLIATTGLRVSEAVNLTLGDVTADGLVIRETKFRKSRLVVIHPTTRDALERYLTFRLKLPTCSRHLFVLRSGEPPKAKWAGEVFRKLAERTGVRSPHDSRGATVHSLRHSFAVRSLESLPPGSDPSRHMLALATCLGHANVSHTYWYLQSTPTVLRSIAEATEQAHHIDAGVHHD